MVKKFAEPILVTKPLVASRDEIFSLFNDVIDSGWLTNMGKQHNLLEKEVADYLNIDNLSVFNNGTLALIVALKALNLPEGSEVITTPFTFAATTHAISWNGLKPIFADINKDTMTLSTDAIEKAITPNTSAILPVHVYGFPCEVEIIEKIAKKNNLKVIYDGAHSFSTKINNKSICEWGDITMLSFHSTKLFNSIEGGGLVYKDENIGRKIYELRNFGIKKFISEEDIKEGVKNKDIIKDIGINGKLNEFQSAWGRVVLKQVKKEQEKRQKVSDTYKKLLNNIKEITIPEMPKNTSNSMQYFPILVENNRDDLYDKLMKHNIYSRKYFYPLCSDFECYKNLPSAQAKNLLVSNEIANKVLCLPFYGELSKNECEAVKKISEIIKVSIL
tara:strand:+ start:1430 stop:2596 length:1167 start_codon:yes stop_codon:yes gene_type:complete